MKVLKRNQIIIFVIALMLVSAGYLNYTALNNDEIATSATTNEVQYAGIGDARLVSSNGIEENSIKNELQADTQNNEITNTTIQSNTQAIVNNVIKNEEKEKNTTQTNNNLTESEQYFTSSKINRDTMYSQMLESYQKILENQNISNDQKAIAQTEIKNINDTKNAIMIAENLIKLKDFDDVLILVNDGSVNVIVKALDLSQDQIAQIQNIVTRELKAELDNIHISTKGA